MSAILCTVCRERRGDLLLCKPCGASYDRANIADLTMAGAIRWAAVRARRFERKRQRSRARQ